MFFVTHRLCRDAIQPRPHQAHKNTTSVPAGRYAGVRKDADLLIAPDARASRRVSGVVVFIPNKSVRQDTDLPHPPKTYSVNRGCCKTVIPGRRWFCYIRFFVSDHCGGCGCSVERRSILVGLHHGAAVSHGKTESGDHAGMADAPWSIPTRGWRRPQGLRDCPVGSELGAV